MVYSFNLFPFHRLKKPLIVFCVVLLLLLNGLIYPKQKADAIVWAGALPAGITVGGGIYALGALAVGSVAVGLGMEYGDEINAHAKHVWSSSTQLAKDSLYASMQATKDAGNVMVKGASAFWDWIATKAEQISSFAITASMSKDITKNATKTNQDVTIDNVPITVATAYPNAVRTYGNCYGSCSDIKFVFPTGSEHLFAMTSATGLSHFESLRFYATSSGIRIEVSKKVANISTITENLTYWNVYVELQRLMSPGTTGITNISYESLGISQAEAFSMLKNAKTVEELLGLAGTMGLDNISIGSEAVYNAWVSAKQKLLTQDIPKMKDAGIVLPVSDVVPKTSEGEALTYNPDAQTYVRPDGTTYPGEIVWTVPKVTVKEIDGIGTVVVPVGNDWVDITTGEIVGQINPTVPDSGSPDWTTPAKGKINFKPLMMVGDLLKSKFPFSVPWDVYKLFSVLNVPPITPVFKIDSGDGVNIAGKHIAVNYKFNVDFSVFDSIAKIIRWGLILVFDIAIVLALRRLTPD